MVIYNISNCNCNCTSKSVPQSTHWICFRSGMVVTIDHNTWSGNGTSPPVLDAVPFQFGIYHSHVRVPVPVDAPVAGTRRHVGCFNHLVRWLHAHMDLTYLAGKIQYFEWVRVASPSHLTSSLGGMTAAMPQNPAFRWPRGHHNSRRDRKTSKPYETLADSVSYVVKISRYGHPPLFVILFVWNPVFGCLVDPGPRRELCAFWNATELATSWTTLLPSSIFGGCWRPALLTHTQFRDMIE
jgi:hypothetical protein